MNMNANPEQAPVGASRRWWMAGVVAAAMVCVGGALIGVRASHAEAPAQAPQAMPVSVAVVQPQDIALWDEFSGRLEAVQRVDVRARVAGAVQSVHFREGALVKKGDLLVTVDPAPYAAEVERAQAQVMAAQARLSYAQGELERALRLWDEHAIAQRELGERRNAQREADANLHAAQAVLQTARLNLGYTQVRAPIAGRVGRIEVTQGNLVAAGPGAPVLTTLVSVNPIYASFDADERVVAQALQSLPGGAAARAAIGRIPVQIGTEAVGGTPFQGQLQFIDNLVDTKSGTVRVRATLDNASGALMPGQFVRIRMGQAHSTAALLISDRAVGTDQSKKYVMVLGQGNKVEYREVQLGASFDGLRVVTAGLKAGETIVVNGLQRVRPGSVVVPQTVPMAARSETQDAGAQQARAGAKSPAV